MSKIWKSDKPWNGSKLLIMLALADFANDDGYAWPSIATVASKCRLSSRQTQRIIHELIDEGALEIAKQGDGRGNSTFYRIKDVADDTVSSESPIKGDICDTVSELKRVTSRARKGDTQRERVTPSAVKGDIAMSPDPLEPSLEPSINRARAPQPSTNAFDTPLDDPRISLDALPDVQPRSQSKPREVNEGQAPPGQLVKRGTGVDAYWIFREYFPQTLTNRQMEMVRETVTDLTRWRVVCERWAEVYGNDWRKFGLLDWYRGGIPEEKGTHHEQRSGNGVYRANHQAGQRPHYANYEPAEYDEERAAELNGWA